MIRVREYKEIYASWRLRIRLHQRTAEVVMIDQPEGALAETVLRHYLLASEVKEIVEELQRWLSSCDMKTTRDQADA